MEKLRIGIALTGSYCTYERAFAAIEELCEKYDVTAIMSETAASTNSRFGAAEDFIRRLESMTGKSVLKTIVEVEPAGPQRMFDVLVIAPCTGNTAAKLANGITDSSVTMAAKSHLRNGRPLLLAIGTNDGLSGSARNIAELLGRKNIYFLPFYQDDPVGKPRSLASDYTSLERSILEALEGRQIQPILGKPCI
ncbi:MAG: dipicolinate synthase subunit B [Oscillospiraceae bacterium]|nr:dipicolinate synthase subunit B [Oscillospiraceae bacterium]